MRANLAEGFKREIRPEKTVAFSSCFDSRTCAQAQMGKMRITKSIKCLDICSIMPRRGLFGRKQNVNLLDKKSQLYFFKDDT